ncbi:MAG TPA: hypothetical protein VK968_07920, partial [Roseimicrobium sp.]|nr:hypothetical protein [Roseimicrobium sp.]
MPDKIPQKRDSGSAAPTAKATAALTLKEIAEAFVADGRYRPILSLNEAAELAHRAPSTVRRLVSEGRFKGSVKQGKPLLFWRDKFV